MICREHNRASKSVFHFFVVDGSMGKLTFKSNFALLSSFQVKFERDVNGSKIISFVNQNMVQGDPV